MYIARRMYTLFLGHRDHRIGWSREKLEWSQPRTKSPNSEPLLNKIWNELLTIRTLLYPEFLIPFLRKQVSDKNGLMVRLVTLSPWQGQEHLFYCNNRFWLRSLVAITCKSMESDERWPMIPKMRMKKWTRNDTMTANWFPSLCLKQLHTN